MSNAWGQLDWGENNWGAQNSTSPLVTSQLLTSSIGAITIPNEGLIETGWGRGTWNNNEAWGIAGTLQTGSIQLSSSIGQVVADAEISTGWGGDTWGENAWGDLAGAYVDVTGSQLTSSIASVTESIDAPVDVTGSQLTGSVGQIIGSALVDVNPTGIQGNLSIGEEDIARGIQQDVTGSQLTNSIGAVTIDDTFLIGSGWGRDTWGNLGWGVNYSAAPSMAALTMSIGDEAAGTDVEVSVTAPNALGLTFANPSFSIQIDQDIFVLATEDQLDMTLGSFTLEQSTNEPVTGQQLTASVGQVEAVSIYEVSGIQGTLTLGNFTLVQSTNESVTGQQLTMTMGNADEIPDQIVGVSGLQASTSIGSVDIVIDCAVGVTGTVLTSTAGSPSIYAWREVDPGVNNNWTEVDLAA
jgi:hypothetical protein